MQEISYLDIDSALKRLDLAASVAEVHGAMSAIACVIGDNSGYRLWQGRHVPEVDTAVANGDALAKESARLAEALYQQILVSLQDGNFAYELMLPNDDVELDLRTEAMAHWCQGFLLGLGFSGITDLQRFNGELAEIISDITEISQVSSGHLDNSEEEEQSYAELVEYLRVGVMLFNETFQSHLERGNTSVH